jgi:hypothetical protein
VAARKPEPSDDTFLDQKLENPVGWSPNPTPGPDSAFRICPRCAGLLAAQTDKCLHCGYRPMTCRPTADQVATVLVVLLFAALGLLLAFF